MKVLILGGFLQFRTRLVQRSRHAGKQISSDEWNRFLILCHRVGCFWLSIDALRSGCVGYFYVDVVGGQRIEPAAIEGDANAGCGADALHLA